MDVEANRIALEQLAVARDAVWASWAGAAANFAVVVVTVALALWSAYETAKLRREVRLRSIDVTLTGIEDALMMIRNMYDGIAKAPKREQLHPQLVRAGMAAPRQILERLPLSEAQAPSLHRVATGLLGVSHAVFEATEGAVAVGKKITNEQFLEINREAIAGLDQAHIELAVHRKNLLAATGSPRVASKVTRTPSTTR